ncbi:unnamed protein product [Notodromas monacha]|uniref:Ig-like domain-containing protein n=1 Tax=Notodromas monacha TaxID=399045 RepID=A0A7R9BHP9_9CRUS|nr:unnamed protein product [Notodromas monacha]CAG0914298.1 unnamed protein product [Notodromas monacha]
MKLFLIGAADLRTLRPAQEVLCSGNAPGHTSVRRRASRYSEKAGDLIERLRCVSHGVCPASVNAIGSSATTFINFPPTCSPWPACCVPPPFTPRAVVPHATNASSNNRPDLHEEKENDVTTKVERSKPASHFATGEKTSQLRSRADDRFSSLDSGKMNGVSSRGSLERQAECKDKKILPPKFYAVPHNKIVEEGDTATFYCTVAGEPFPKVTWDKDNVKIRLSEGEEDADDARDPDRKYRMVVRKDLRILEVFDVCQEDAGLYRVTIENSYGRTQASARLDVLRLPSRVLQKCQLTETKLCSVAQASRNFAMFGNGVFRPLQIDRQGPGSLTACATSPARDIPSRLSSAAVRAARPCGKGAASVHVMAWQVRVSHRLKRAIPDSNPGRDMLTFGSIPLLSNLAIFDTI